jgi:Protein of unknown function (DUF1217)
VLSTSATFKILTQNIDKSLARIRETPQVQRETTYYLDTISKIKSIEDFLANDRVYTYAMKAFGLKDMVYAKAFVKKVLTDGIDSANSFTNQLTDPRFKELATAFNFKSLGATTTLFDRTQKGVVDKYVQVELEQQAGSSNDGVRLALYFRRKASEITSAYSILGDAALYKVAQVALGLTSSGSANNLDMQAEIIKNKIDLENIKDPAVLNKFLMRFTTMWEIKNGTSTSSIPNLVLGQGVQSLTSTETLAKIQSLRFGGSR